MKVTPKKLLKCYKRAREQGLKGDEMLSFIAACAREPDEQKG